MRLALAALLVTATLGTLLAAGLALPLPLAFPVLTDVHLGWGLGGWALALLAGVSTFVVPMFQLTPAYPAGAARRLAPALGLLLLLWSLRAIFPDSAWSALAEAAGAGIALLAAVWAIATLRLQAGRRRKVGDATFHFFRAGMFCLIAATAGFVAMLAAPALAGEPRLATGLGVLLLPGTFSCVIQGMLYKIVPFLAWLHLQRTGAPVASLPNMRAFVPEGAARGQLRLHLAALAALLLAVAWPTLPFVVPVAGLLLAASYAWLGLNLARAAARYRGFRDRIRAAAADRGW
jgi:hypothetical protein